jgi:hypothetical protein
MVCICDSFCVAAFAHLHNNLTGPPLYTSVRAFQGPMHSVPMPNAESKPQLGASGSAHPRPHEPSIDCEGKLPFLMLLYDQRHTNLPSLLCVSDQKHHGCVQRQHQLSSRAPVYFRGTICARTYYGTNGTCCRSP